ncbi:MAG: T9SS type A sorting domain-containing protein [Bacteroidota bacterium]|jgi:hypothetical protein
MKPYIYAIFLIAIVTSHCPSQWSTDPTQNVIVGYGLNPEICSDSAGGCYITYEQNLSYPRNLMVKRLNRYGYKTWSSPVRIYGQLPEQAFAKITEDGQGGVLISYSDEEFFDIGGLSRIRVQRVDSCGNLLWGSIGVRVSLSETNQDEQAIVSDGKGECIVAWVDTLGDLRMNRINDAGTRSWGDSGKYVWNSPATPLMVSDEQKGVIMIFGASRIQRFDSLGNGLWGPIGVQQDQLGIYSVASDGYGGLVIAGMKYLDYNNGDPYWKATCQRVDSNGSVLWGSDGMILEDSLQNLVTNPPGITLATNFAGGATFAWQKKVRPNTLRSFSQRVRENGQFVFQDGPMPVSAIDSLGNGTWSILTSLNDSKIYVLADGRPNKPLVAQRIDSTGVRLWDTSDVVISSRSLGYLKTATDGKDGIIIVGFDQSDFSIRAQQCSRNGDIGEIMTEVDEHKGSYTPNKIKLYHNYPNPFNPSTVIEFDLPTKDLARLDVYNILGQKVRTIISDMLKAGHHSVNFNATGLPSGSYFYRLSTGSPSGQAGKFTDMKRMLMIK